MAKNHWFFHNERANRSVLVVMNVTAANSDRVNLYLHVVGSQFGGQRDFPNRQFTFAFEHESFHKLTK